MNRLACLSGILLFALFASTIHAEPRLVEETRFYDLNGATEKEICAQMRTHGPGGFSANTKWNSRYHFQSWRQGMQCAVILANVTVHVDIHHAQMGE